MSSFVLFSILRNLFYLILIHQGDRCRWKNVVVQIAVLQALVFLAFDTLHAALPFLSHLLVLADTEGYEVARFSEAWHNGLPLVTLLLPMYKATCWVYVFVFRQFHTSSVLSISA